MRLQKRFLAVFLCVCCFVGMLILPGGGMTAEAASGNYKEQLTLLNALHIVDIPPDEFKERGTVTREEILTSAFALLKVETDAENVLEWAANFGMISSAASDEYGLTSHVTYNQAFKILSVAMGFEVVAQEKGGYPNGYATAATMAGIRDGISGSGESNLTKGDYVQMLYNALFGSMMESNYSTGEPAWTVKQTPIITDIFHIYRVTGVVTRNRMTGLYSVDGLEEDRVVIGDVSYRVGNTDAADLLGYSVIAYVQDSQTGTADEILCITADENRDLQIDESEFLSVSDDFRELRYQPKDGYEKTVPIAVGASVIYNNKLYPEYQKTDFQIRDGYIRLIDNGNDGSYDVVMIYSYETVVVDSISVPLRRVKNLYGDITKNLERELTYLVLDERVDDYELDIRLSDGTAMEFSELQRMDVLSVLRSKSGGDKERIEVTVSRESVFDTLDSSGSTRLMIGGMDYDYVEEFGIYMKGTTSDKALSYGTEYTFILTASGKVAAAFADADAADSEEYVYLKSVAQSGVWKYQMLYMDTDGFWHETQLASKVLYNDVRCSAEDVADALDDLHQVIKIKTDADGCISSIRTAVQSNTADKDRFVYKTVTATYRGPRTFNAELFVEDDVTVLLLPKDLDAGDRKEYGVVDRTWFKSNIDYTVTAYDFDEFDFVSLLTLQTTDSKFDATKSEYRQNYFIVKEAMTMLDDEGGQILALDGAMGAYASITLSPADGVDMKAVQPGDVLFIEQNHRGEIQNWAYAYKRSDGVKKSALASDWSKYQYQIITGVIEKVDADNLRMKIGVSDGKSQSVKLSSPTRVSIYNEKTHTISTETAASLSEGEFVVLHMSYAGVQSAVVYRDK